MRRNGRDGPPSTRDILGDIYALYDGFSTGLDVACRRGCCICCTQAVTITTLEGRRICRTLLGRIDEPGNEALIRTIRSPAPTSPPPVSTNEFVRLCLEDRDPPEDPHRHRSAPCVFLSGGECLIYPDRPFGCRAFFSAQPCRRGGSAVMDPFLLTVNSLFLQFIEDLDMGGCFGPMNGVLSFLLRGGSSDPPLPALNSRDGHPATLARNIPIPALMIPPEHEGQIQTLLRELRAIRHRHGMTRRANRRDPSRPTG